MHQQNHRHIFELAINNGDSLPCAIIFSSCPERCTMDTTFFNLTKILLNFFELWTYFSVERYNFHDLFMHVAGTRLYKRNKRVQVNFREASTHRPQETLKLLERLKLDLIKFFQFPNQQEANYLLRVNNQKYFALFCLPSLCSTRYLQLQSVAVGDFLCRYNK